MHTHTQRSTSFPHRERDIQWLADDGYSLHPLLPSCAFDQTVSSFKWFCQISSLWFRSQTMCRWPAIAIPFLWKPSNVCAHICRTNGQHPLGSLVLSNKSICQWMNMACWLLMFWLWTAGSFNPILCPLMIMSVWGIDWCNSWYKS